MIVIEGLRTANRSLGENDDHDVVFTELSKVMTNDSSFTRASVRKAIRMPYPTESGRSIVLVELDTNQHEVELISLKKAEDKKTGAEDIVQVWSLLQYLSNVLILLAPTSKETLHSLLVHLFFAYKLIFRQ